MEKPNTMLQATGLWINEGNNGTYLAGSLGGIKVLIFKNKKKETGEAAENAPDYFMCFAQNEKRGKGD